MYIYRLAIIYRFAIVFMVGYACASLLTVNLSILLQYWLQKVDAVYLAAMLAILFYISFFIIGFCITSLKKLSMYSITLSLSLFIIYRVVG